MTDEMLPADMKNTFVTLGVAIVVLALLLCGIFFALGGSDSLARRRRFDHLLETCDWPELMSTSLTLIRSHTNVMTYARFDSGEKAIRDLPQLISSMNPTHVSVRPDGLSIELHGGSDHFGFTIHQSEGEWILYSYTERKRSEVLRVKQEEILSSADHP